MAIELENRYLVDPTRWLVLSDRDFSVYHQAEVWSWKVSKVVPEFWNKVSHLLSEQSLWQFQSFVSRMDPSEKLKVRVRDILRFGDLPRAEFTVKKKYPDVNGFKKYDEENFDIPTDTAQQIIQAIAPPIIIGTHTEYGVYKHRHRTMQDGLIFDLDVLKRANTGITTLEIEVDEESAIVIPPPYVVCQINGDPRFKMFGTRELQIKPWLFLSESERRPYYDAMR